MTGAGRKAREHNRKGGGRKAQEVLPREGLTGAGLYKR